MNLEENKKKDQKGLSPFFAHEKRPGVFCYPSPATLSTKRERERWRSQCTAATPAACVWATITPVRSASRNDYGEKDGDRGREGPKGEERRWCCLATRHSSVTSKEASGVVVRALHTTRVRWDGRYQNLNDLTLLSSAATIAFPAGGGLESSQSIGKRKEKKRKGEVYQRQSHLGRRRPEASK